MKLYSISWYDTYRLRNGLHPGTIYIYLGTPPHTSRTNSSQHSLARHNQTYLRKSKIWEISNRNYDLMCL